MRSHHGQDVGSHILASIVNELLEAGLEALAFLNNGLWSDWPVGWTLFRFHTNQVQHGLDSFLHRFVLRRLVVLFLHQRFKVRLGILAHDCIQAYDYTEHDKIC
jgi:hypothetical protein